MRFVFDSCVSDSERLIVTALGEVVDRLFNAGLNTSPSTRATVYYALIEAEKATLKALEQMGYYLHQGGGYESWTVRKVK